MPTTARLLTRHYRPTTCRVVGRTGTDWPTVIVHVLICCAFLALVVAVGFAIGVHMSNVDAAALSAAGR